MEVSAHAMHTRMTAITEREILCHEMWEGARVCGGVMDRQKEEVEEREEREQEIKGLQGEHSSNDLLQKWNWHHVYF